MVSAEGYEALTLTLGPRPCGLLMSDLPVPTPPTQPRSYRRADEGSRVLVVEDIPVTREHLNRLLKHNGYVVTLADSSAAALSALEEGLPDLLVLDLLLPDGHGLDVCRQLRGMPGGEEIPVLVITVDDRAEVHSECIRAGADDFLRKPILPVELQTRARSLIRLRQIRGELRRDHEAILQLQAHKDRLTQFVVHDLKNMLGSLLASVELLEAGADPCRNTARIAATAHSMLGMVQGMLDLSVHDHAGLVPRPDPLDLDAWIAQIVLEMESIAIHRRQRLLVCVQAGLDLEADGQLLRRALFNLLENASKYGPPDSTIRMEVAGDAGHIQLSIADEGEGIPDEMKHRVFERFVRLDPKAHAYAGRGLGLAFCRLVMDLHGGRVWVEDAPSRGSRFVMELPRKFWGL